MAFDPIKSGAIFKLKPQKPAIPNSTSVASRPQPVYSLPIIAPSFSTPDRSNNVNIRGFENEDKNQIAASFEKLYRESPMPKILERAIQEGVSPSPRHFTQPQPPSYLFAAPSLTAQRPPIQLPPSQPIPLPPPPPQLPPPQLSLPVPLPQYQHFSSPQLSQLSRPMIQSQQPHPAPQNELQTMVQSQPFQSHYQLQSQLPISPLQQYQHQPELELNLEFSSFEFEQFDTTPPIQDQQYTELGQNQQVELELEQEVEQQDQQGQQQQDQRQEQQPELEQEQPELMQEQEQKQPELEQEHEQEQEQPELELEHEQEQEQEQEQEREHEHEHEHEHDQEHEQEELEQEHQQRHEEQPRKQIVLIPEAPPRPVFPHNAQRTQIPISISTRPTVYRQSSPVHLTFDGVSSDTDSTHDYDRIPAVPSSDDSSDDFQLEAEPKPKRKPIPTRKPTARKRNAKPTKTSSSGRKSSSKKSRSTPKKRRNRSKLMYLEDLDESVMHITEDSSADDADWSPSDADDYESSPKTPRRTSPRKSPRSKGKSTTEKRRRTTLDTQTNSRKRQRM